MPFVSQEIWDNLLQVAAEYCTLYRASAPYSIPEYFISSTARSNRADNLMRHVNSYPPSVSHHRAQLVTEFMQTASEQSPAIRQANAFLYLCQHLPIGIGQNEMIVGERGEGGVPRAVPTFPELWAHTRDHLEQTRARSTQKFSVSDSAICIYEQTVYPFWKGKSVVNILESSLSSELKSRNTNFLNCGAFTQVMLCIRMLLTSYSSSIFFNPILLTLTAEFTMLVSREFRKAKQICRENR